MSIDTVALKHEEIQKPGDVEELSVTFETEIKDSTSLAWRQISRILSNSFRHSGFPQPAITSVKRQRTPVAVPIAILVAPGIVVGGEEYEQRYGGIDLEEYKRQMSPELFKAFVRHIGCIPGKPGLDLGEIVSTPE